MLLLPFSWRDAPPSFNDSLKTVAMSSDPNQAEVWINGNRMGTTPISLDLANSRSHTVVFRKAGHKEITCELHAEVDRLWVVLDVLAGLVPIIVDAATGAWKGIEQGACNGRAAGCRRCLAGERPSTD